MLPGPGSYEASELTDNVMNTCWRKRIKDKFILINKQKLQRQQDLGQSERKSFLPISNSVDSLAIVAQPSLMVN